MRWSRRRLLQGFGGAAGTALLGCRPSPDDEATTPTEAFAMPGCPHDAIVSSLLAERVDALLVLQKWLLAKTSTDALYAAALVVGARTAVTEVDRSGLDGDSAERLVVSDRAGRGGGAGRQVDSVE